MDRDLGGGERDLGGREREDHVKQLPQVRNKMKLYS